MSKFWFWFWLRNLNTYTNMFFHKIDQSYETHNFSEQTVYVKQFVCKIFQKSNFCYFFFADMRILRYFEKFWLGISYFPTDQISSYYKYLPLVLWFTLHFLTDLGNTRWISYCQKLVFGKVLYISGRIPPNEKKNSLLVIGFPGTRKNDIEWYANSHCKCWR